MQNDPQKLLAEYNKKYSAAWKLADEFRADRGKDIPDWPAWFTEPTYPACPLAWILERDN